MPARRLLGELLMDAGQISAAQLEQALYHGRTRHVRVGRAMVQLGFISEQQLLEVLGQQLMVPIAPEYRLRQLKPPRAVLDLVPSDVAHSRRLLPIFHSAQEGALSLVVADPLDLAPLAQLKQRHHLSRIRVLLASEPLLDELITLFYGPRTVRHQASVVGWDDEGLANPPPVPIPGQDFHASQAPPAPMPGNSFASVASAGAPSRRRDESTGQASVSMAGQASVSVPGHASVSMAGPSSLSASGSAAAPAPGPASAAGHSSASMPAAATPASAPASVSAPTAGPTRRAPVAEPVEEHQPSQASVSISARVTAPGKGFTPTSPSAVSSDSTQAAKAPVSLFHDQGQGASGLAQPAKGASTGTASAAPDHPGVGEAAPRHDAPASPPTAAATAPSGPAAGTAQASASAPASAHASAPAQAPASAHPEPARASEASHGLERNAASLPHDSADQRLTRTTSARDGHPEEEGGGRFLEFYLKTIDFFFSLLEEDKSAPSQRQLRQISQMTRLLAQRLGVPARLADSVAIAGYFYSFGELLVGRGVFGAGVTADSPLKLASDLLAGFGPPLPVVPILQAFGEDQPTQDFSVQEPGFLAALLKATATYIESRDGSKRFTRAGQEKALRFLRENRGTRFDARAVDAILALTDKENLLGKMEAPSEASRDVLLVDKDRISLEMLELRFRKEGFQVRVARTGEEALRLVDLQPPQLIIAEVTLPKVDGFELCARLKNDERTRDIPFFFLSSRTDASHVTKGLELGAEDFLTKPVNLDILIGKVRRLERAQEAQREAQHQALKNRSPGAIRGDLAQIALFDLLQVLQLGQKTTRVVLEQGNRRCELALDNGNLVFATLDNKRGREAFFELCLWEQGHFQVIPDKAPAERNIQDSNDFLLMEGMRRADEAKVGIAQDGK